MLDNGLVIKNGPKLFKKGRTGKIEKFSEKFLGCQKRFFRLLLKVIIRIRLVYYVWNSFV